MAPTIVLALLEEGLHADMRQWRDAAEGAALLRSRGHETELTLVKSPRQGAELLDRLRAHPPRVLFLVGTVFQLTLALGILRGLRKEPIPGDPRVMIGGGLATDAADRISREPGVGALILGEWQTRLEELLRTLKSKGDVRDITGLWWREESGWYQQVDDVSASRPDDWPDPQYQGLPLEPLLVQNERCLPLRAGRGGAFSHGDTCLIPGLGGSSSKTPFRLRSPERVVKEALQLLRQCHAKSFQFVDELFPWKDEWLLSFCKLWSEQVRCPFRYATTPEHMIATRLAMLKAAGGATVDVVLAEGLRVHPDSPAAEALARAVSRASSQGVRVALHVPVGLDHTPDPAPLLEFLRGLPLAEVHAHPALPAPADASQFGEDWSASVESETHQLRGLDLLLRCAGCSGGEGLTWNALADAPQARLRAPSPASAKIARFSAHNGAHNVLALRVPAEASFEVELPENPCLAFGILLEPTLPGVRLRRPVQFDIRLLQDGRNFRIFRKVLVQALDPDSRRWHFFRLALLPSRPGKATLVLDNFILGEATRTPTPGPEIWAGWAEVAICSGTMGTEAELR